MKRSHQILVFSALGMSFTINLRAQVQYYDVTVHRGVPQSYGGAAAAAAQGDGIMKMMDWQDRKRREALEEQYMQSREQRALDADQRAQERSEREQAKKERQNSSDIELNQQIERWREETRLLKEKNLEQQRAEQRKAEEEKTEQIRLQNEKTKLENELLKKQIEALEQKNKSNKDSSSSEASPEKPTATP